MHLDLLSLARRLERAQALQNERFNHAAGGRSLPLGGGFAHYRGEGHPLNQALGLTEPLSSAELAAAETFLGSPTVLELSPAADASLWPLLAERGYRLHQFQQLWARSLAIPVEAAASDAGVRQALEWEASVFNRVVFAGFTDEDAWEGLVPAFEVSLAVEGAWGYLVEVEGEVAGGGMLGIVEGVALLSGDAVLPRFRGRGLQKALIRARLAFAQARGCEVACASTAPGTASQRSYEGCDFRAAYPKVEMARG